MALSISAACAGVGGVDAMMCGFFAWALKAERESSNVANQLLNRLMVLRIEFMGSWPIVVCPLDWVGGPRRELEENVNVSDVIRELSVLHGGFKSNLFCSQRGLLVKAVTKTGDDAENLHFAIDTKANLEGNFALNF